MEKKQASKTATVLGTQVTEASISAVKKMIECYARYTLRDIAQHVGITSAAAHAILTERLGLRKLCACWLPYLLTKEQKAYRVKCARELLKTYKNCQNKWILTELLTGDESWIYFFESPRKISNKYGLLKTEIDQILQIILKVRKSSLCCFLQFLRPCVARSCTKRTLHYWDFLQK